MDIDAEIESLSLIKRDQALAWEARAKITWGDPREKVLTWLADNGIDLVTAERIVAIAVRERAIALRANGVRDLVLGVLVGVGGAGVGVGVTLFVQAGRIAVPLRGMAVLVALSFLVFMYDVHLTWRGLVRIIGGARIRGAVSDVDG